MYVLQIKSSLDSTAKVFAAGSVEPLRLILIEYPRHYPKGTEVAYRLWDFHNGFFESSEGAWKDADFCVPYDGMRAQLALNYD